MSRKKHICPAENDNEGIPGCNIADDIILENDFSELEAMADEQERLFKACAHKVVTCFKDICDHLNRHQAREMFKDFLKSPLSKLPKRGGRRSKEERDRKFMDNYDAAQKSKKESVISAFAEKNHMTFETARRTLRDAQAKAKAKAKVYRNWAEGS